MQAGRANGAGLPRLSDGGNAPITSINIGRRGRRLPARRASDFHRTNIGTAEAAIVPHDGQAPAAMTVDFMTFLSSNSGSKYLGFELHIKDCDTQCGPEFRHPSRQIQPHGNGAPVPAIVCHKSGLHHRSSGNSRLNSSRPCDRPMRHASGRIRQGDRT